MGAIPIESAAVLAIVGGMFALDRASPVASHARSRWRWPCSAVIVIAGLVGTSRVARRAAVDALRPELRGQIVDVILTPNPSSPLCWAAIAIELREAEGEYVLWRGTLSLAPEWRPPADCDSHRSSGHARWPRSSATGRFVLRDAIHQPLRQLRALAERDCWVRAWLRFGRAPVIDGGSIYDLRFARAPRRELLVHAPRGRARGMSAPRARLGDAARGPA